MKEAIQRMREIAHLAKKHEWDESVTVKIQLSHVFAILEFYEQTVKGSGLSENKFENGGYTDAEINCNSGCMWPCGQCKEDSLPDSPDITPEWDKIPKGFDWVAVDEDGEEYRSIHFWRINLRATSISISLIPCTTSRKK